MSSPGFWARGSLPRSRSSCGLIGSGAGPHYGIFTPEQVREEVQLDRDDCATDQIEPPRSEQPFPITAAHIRDELAPVRPYPSRRTLPGRTSDTAAVC